MQPTNDIVRGIGAGVISACLFLLVIIGLPFFSQFSLLPIFYIGLRDGPQTTLTASGVAAVIVLLAMNLATTVVFALFLLIPAIYLLSRALMNRAASDGTQEWYPLGLLVIQGLVLGLLVMGGIFTVLTLTLDESATAKFYEGIQSQPAFKGITASFTLDALIDLLKILPGMAGLGMFVTYALNGALAQQILLQQQKNLRPNFDIKTLEMPLWPWMGLAIFGVVAAIFQNSLIGDFALNVVLVLLAAFMLQGLSIFHVFCEGMSQKNLLLWGFYFIMLVFPWLMVIVVVFGVFEPWLNLRHKIKGNFRS